MIQLILSIGLVIALAACQTFKKTTSLDPSHKTYGGGKVLIPNNKARDGGKKLLTLNNKTRGGTVKGSPVKHDKTVSPFFEKISKAKTKKEKDRLAILSQTGEFQVHFEFLETMVFGRGNNQLPYYSWSTEYIFPIKNEKNFISLQHILVIRVEGSDKAHVIKHWRQDWTFQDPVILEYQGYQTWKKKKLPSSLVRGQWSQAVFQVDDSPRYKTYGTWTHGPNLSRWISVETNRPLPRREYSVRSDYQILKGVNTVTVTLGSWYHEQNNLKAVVKASGKVSDFKVSEYLSGETGLNRYERIRDFDFSEGKKYWESTKDYWREVRLKWKAVIKSKDSLRLKTKVYGKELYKAHFEFAQKMVDNKNNKKIIPPEEIKKHAESTINDFLDRNGSPMTY